MNTLLRTTTALVAGALGAAAAHAQGERWAYVSPPQLANHAMTVDTNRNVLVMFGGYGPGNRISDDVFEMDLATGAWRTRSVSPRPAPRLGHTLVFDSSRNVTVLYGGSNNIAGPGSFTDTWEWDGTAWSAITTAQNPGLRFEHAATFDPIREVTVLDGGGANDTWEYDGNDWTRIFSSAFGPGPRSCHAMIFAPNLDGNGNLGTGVCLMVKNPNAQPSAGAPMETWTWDGATWTRVLGNLMQPREDFGLAFDDVRGRPVLFGGRVIQGPLIGTASAEVREMIPGGIWPLPINPAGPGQVQIPLTECPAPRFQTPMVTDPGQGVLAFGGIPQNGEPFGALWRWDGSDWRLLTPTTESRGVIAFDSNRQVMVQHGSHTVLPSTVAGGGGEVYDTFEFSAQGAWSRPQNAGGPTRAAAEMAFDSVRNVTVMEDTNGQLWEWDGSVWASRFPANPPASLVSDLVFDISRSAVVRLGLSLPINQTLQLQVHQWDGTDWSPLPTPNLVVPVFVPGPQPAPVANVPVSMAYDERNQEIVLYERNGPTFILDPNGTWSQRTPLTSPGILYPNFSMTYDRGRQKVVLLGAVGPWNPREVWEWDGVTWAHRNPANLDLDIGPGQTQLEFDSTRGRCITFGGHSGLDPTTQMRQLMIPCDSLDPGTLGLPEISCTGGSPVLGETFTISYAIPPTASFLLLSLSEPIGPPLQAVHPLLCLSPSPLWLDPGTATSLLVFGPSASLQIPIPNNPTFANAPLTMQALVTNFSPGLCFDVTEGFLARIDPVQ